MADGLGKGPQPDSSADDAVRLGKQGPHLVDGTGNGGAVYAELAGEYVVGGCMAQVDQGGRQPVDEHQLVLRTSPTARFRCRETSRA
ncbi:hypothetical protein ACIP93_37210 [Streptomyces sp. NPDC088745]|uniref:hypothetical protein n=1 Tax=Streptomyces sp. NPDC088745 TaxID=3365884 RepID=UPI00382BD520